MLQSQDRHYAPVKPKFDDEIRFLQSWFQSPLKTGAVSPSGRALAKMMASYLDPAIPGPVIELGPGTGPVTKALLDRGFAPERLFLIEYNREFCSLLRLRYPGVTVLHGDAYAMADTLKGRLPGPAVGVISSLPLFTRSPADRERMVEEAFDLSVPNAPFVQFTYAVVSPVPLKPGQIEGERSPRVWMNLPPARVWAYRRP